jgi:hypothetical protein
MIELVADLQSVRDHNLVVASLDFAKEATFLADVESHPQVLVEDGEGQSCWGYIERLDDRLAYVRLDLSTWWSDDQVEIATQFAGSGSAYIATASSSPSESVRPTTVLELV